MIAPAKNVTVAKAAGPAAESDRDGFVATSVKARRAVRVATTG